MPVSSSLRTPAGLESIIWEFVVQWKHKADRLAAIICSQVHPMWLLITLHTPH